MDLTEDLSKRWAGSSASDGLQERVHTVCNIHVDDGINISRFDQAQIMLTQGNSLLSELQALGAYVLSEQLAGFVLTAEQSAASVRVRVVLANEDLQRVQDRHFQPTSRRHGKSEAHSQAAAHILRS